MVWLIFMCVTLPTSVLSFVRYSFVTKQLSIDFILVTLLRPFRLFGKSHFFCAIWSFWNAIVLSKFSCMCAHVHANAHSHSKIKRLFMSNALFLTPQDFDCLFLFTCLSLSSCFCSAMPIFHIKLIDIRWIGVIHVFIYDDFNFCWHFFFFCSLLPSSLRSTLLCDCISFRLQPCQYWTIFHYTKMRVHMCALSAREQCVG